MVTLPKEKAVERILERDKHLTEELARDRLALQIDDKERLKYATFSYSSADASFKENEKKIMNRLKALKL